MPSRLTVNGCAWLGSTVTDGATVRSSSGYLKVNGALLFGGSLPSINSRYISSLEVEEILARHPAVRVPHGVDHATFTDTAALAGLMDLVVTADSTVAHMAGALGVPTLLLLPLAPDWRWMAGRDDSPWYPGMRLLRQAARAGDPAIWLPTTLALADPTIPQSWNVTADSLAAWLAAHLPARARPR